MSSSRFLAAINNELPLAQNETYAKNLASLDTLVLVLFTEDRTVVPKESGWFGSESIQGSVEFRPEQQSFSEKTTIPMHLQPLYIHDWIGLRTLDERGGVIFEQCEGAHMRISNCWEGLVRRFVGGS